MSVRSILRPRQRGMTLVVALVMLMVLTLLVVSAIRFGNINLRISGNAQTETEATAAAQVALEEAVRAINSATDIGAIAAKANYVVSTGGTSYKVNVSKPACVISRNIATATLNPAVVADRACFGNAGADPILDASGNPVGTASECRDQQWEVSAKVEDAGGSSGANLTLLQGVAVRVGAEVQCPT